MMALKHIVIFSFGWGVLAACGGQGHDDGHTRGQKTATQQTRNIENIRPYTCQHKQCSKDSAEAVLKCLDPSVCATYTDAPPPMYLCQKCYDEMDRKASALFIHVNQPADLVSQICDNVDCRFGFMKALYFCFSLDCIKRNDYKPIRLCQDCHERFV